MPSQRDEENLRAQKAPRWISPWAFDDEYVDEVTRPVRRQKQVEEAERKRAEQAEAKPPTVNLVQPKQVEVPAVSSKLFISPEIRARESGLDEARPQVDDDSRFRPPVWEANAEHSCNWAPPKSSIQPSPEIKASAPRPEVPVATAEARVPPSSVPVAASRKLAYSKVSSSGDQGKPFPWAAVITGLLGLAGAVLLGSIYLGDHADLNDKELTQLGPVDIAPKIQGPARLSTFLHAVVPMKNMDQALKPAWKWEPAFLQTHLEANSLAIDALRDLLGDFDWHPKHSAWNLEDYSEHPSWPHARILLQARVARLLLLGDETSALQAALDLGRISRSLQELHAWPYYTHRALEFHAACVQTVAFLLERTRLSGPALKGFHEDFARLTPQDDLLRQALAAIYLHHKKIFFGEASGAALDTMPGGSLHGRAGRLFFKKRETLALISRACQVLQEEVRVPPFQRGALSDPERGLPLPRAHPLHPNRSGHDYFITHLQPFYDLPQRHHLAKARHDLVRLLFGIRRQIAETQKLAVTLADLAPTYLVDLPLDPFSGEPMQYEPHLGLLHSVGIDFRREEGRLTDPPLAYLQEPTLFIGIKSAQPVGGDDATLSSKNRSTSPTSTTASSNKNPSPQASPPPATTSSFGVPLTPPPSLPEGFHQPLSPPTMPVAPAAGGFSTPLAPPDLSAPLAPPPP